jgi:hypothetical protein
MNPYNALMKAGQQSQPQQMQATPVHHEGDPAYGRLEQALSDVDGELRALPMGAPEYDDLLAMKQHLAGQKSNILRSHEQLAGRQRGLDAKNRFGTIANDPAINQLEHGIMPGRQ